LNFVTNHGARIEYGPGAVGSSATSQPAPNLEYDFHMASERDDPWQSNLKQLGKYIRSQRKLAEMSQRELASLVNLSDTYMSQLERGLHEPSIRVLRSISDGLNIGMDTLLRFMGADPKEGSEEHDERPVRAELGIMADPDLSESQKRALLEVLRSFRGDDDQTEN
jgi:transcriptional regulator with XRE-family HTH domain